MRILFIILLGIFNKYSEILRIGTGFSIRMWIEVYEGNIVLGIENCRS